MSYHRHADFVRLERDWGIIPLANDWLPDDFKGALDAQIAAITPASAGIPVMMTTYVDPKIVRVLQAPNQGAKILGEQKAGDWTTRTQIFTVVENVGEIAAYGDRNNNGMSNVNATWPQRQSFHFQTIIDVGDREADMAGEAKLNWIQEMTTSASKTLNKFMDLTYHYGVAGLQNYGLLNDPALTTALAPSTKTAGGVTWNSSVGVQNAQGNEIFTDIQTLVSNLIARTFGLVDTNTPMTLAMSPQSSGALAATNQFGINVGDLMKQNYPNLSVEVSGRYATASGNVIQLIAKEFDGNETGYCAFTEKMREHPVVRQLSSYQQKRTAGTWGAIIRYPVAIAQMIGV